MNFSDSDRLAEVLELHGYQGIQGKGYQAADIVLVNTCCVRQNAEDVALQYVASLKGLKKKNPKMIIGVCGCVPVEPGMDILKRYPHVDLVFGPNEVGKLREYLKPSPTALRAVPPLPMGEGNKRGEGLVTITHGCDNFCSYCVVPYVRGREVSRPINEVLDEVEKLVGQGTKEIILLGQNVNSYKYGLDNLLKQFALRFTHYALRDLRVQFLTSHPRDMSDDIIEAVADLPYMAKEFMMPLQSGDDEILNRMNRGYTLDHYLGRVSKIRSLMPIARISTDILVGFPGESEAQFQNTLKAVEEIGFNEVHMFAYSSRPGTASAHLPDQLSEGIKQERLQRLIKTVRALLS